MSSDAASPRLCDVLLYGGLLLALLDILNAIGFWYLGQGVGPQVVLQSIASGVMGRAAFAGGWASAAAGAALHVLMALAIAGVFGLACRRWPVLHRRPGLSGPAYGVLVYVVMHHVVVPLSLALTGPFNLAWFCVDFIGHLLLVGWPLALVARRSARRAQGLSAGLPAGGRAPLR